VEGTTLTDRSIKDVSGQITDSDGYGISDIDESDFG